MFFSSCASSVRYQKVYIPTQCQIQKQERPVKSGDLIKDLKAILIYTELIEKDLNFCRGE
ncbi:hypothetical protein [Helicobacter sp. 12S02232-10]|uniref:hypothetical protein n=1 Tax=Helicobacter sp. 12S02232-10 TaxID=1476197 RepID=UPI0021518079|nr:hypothetical protein [Helicobacter sp. 12S02232-10]